MQDLKNIAIRLYMEIMARAIVAPDDRGILVLRIPDLDTIVFDALQAERERCAQIAESFIPSGFRGGDGKLADAIGIARDDRARTIAHAIRRG